jgi:hypothetical protein
MKIVVLDGYTENPGDLSWDALEKLGKLKVYDRTSADQIIENIGDSEIVYTNKTPITSNTLDACPNVKFIPTWREYPYPLRWGMNRFLLFVKLCFWVQMFYNATQKEVKKACPVIELLDSGSTRIRRSRC